MGKNKSQNAPKDRSTRDQPAFLADEKIVDPNLVSLFASSVSSLLPNFGNRAFTK